MITFKSFELADNATPVRKIISVLWLEIVYLANEIEMFFSGVVVNWADGGHDDAAVLALGFRVAGVPKIRITVPFLVIHQAFAALYLRNPLHEH